jgi:hypothetical protein
VPDVGLGYGYFNGRVQGNAHFQIRRDRNAHWRLGTNLISQLCISQYQNLLMPDSKVLATLCLSR